MKIDLIIYGIKRGDGFFDKNYWRLRELLELDFCLNTIEVINEIETINNPRSGEMNVVQNKRRFFSDSKYISKSYKQTSRFSSTLKIAQNFPDIHSDAYRSVQNLVQQLLMLQDGLLLSENKFVISIRDDLVFNPIGLANSIKRFRKIRSHEQSFLTSFFHGNTGLSERFMVTQNPGSAVMLNRVEAVKDFLLNSNSKQYCHTCGLNGEWLARYVSDINGLVPICAPIFTKRIRANGVQKERIFTPPHRWHHEIDNFEGLRKFVIGKDT
jgi:hypothetical protein